MQCCEQLTVVMTTSPVRSNPSTEFLEEVFESFAFVSGLIDCPKLLIFDGYEIYPLKSEKRGRISADMEDKYLAYIEAVQSLVETHPAFAHTVCVVLGSHHGFGHAVRRALTQVRTPFVMVLQHDFAFCRSVPLPLLLQVLTDHAHVKYIGLLSNATEGYAEARTHGPAQNQPLPIEHFNDEPFVKLLFFYDKAHVAQTDYYRNVVFGKHCCVRRGDFIEDRFGHWQLKKIYLEGLSAHIRFGTYLWYPENGLHRHIQHLQGRKFLLERVKDELYPARVGDRSPSEVTSEKADAG
eukprot:TRINITY_DN32670_c0_g1_i1.p1 TRINITY_DN32670_c0_g1~~TRINITY_DN32670_c0_g1_i1.p1  ORF type:complete len:295 (+),score=11.70 TRINITY_DN32670_c0_g1_i1:210-1094(+)